MAESHLCAVCECIGWQHQSSVQFIIEQAIGVYTVSVIDVVNLDKAALIITGLATALAAQAATWEAKRRDKYQKREDAFVAAENRRARVLVSAWKLHTSYACLVPCRLTSATWQERLNDGSVL